MAERKVGDGENDGGGESPAAVAFSAAVSAAAVSSFVSADGSFATDALAVVVLAVVTDGDA